MKILFVCLGNICRSPTAEIVFRDLLAREAPQLAVSADSAGTGGYQIGAPADRRTREAAIRRGYDLSPKRARCIEAGDFRDFDLLLAVDRSTRSILLQRAPEAQQRVRLLLEYAPELGIEDVPDPYYGGPNGFEQVLDLIEAAVRGLIVALKPPTGAG
jgi:protein-tyrosine phosphatase